MVEHWINIHKWKTDDNLNQWLREQGLENSQAIILKLVQGEILTFAKGTRRLRYERNNFYLDKFFEERSDYGAGKEIDIKALQQRFQSMMPGAVIQVKLVRDKEATAVGIYETDKLYADNRMCYIVTLNPFKLRTPQKVMEKVRWIEQNF